MITTLKELKENLKGSWYIAIKARSWEPYEFETIKEPQKTYKAAYEIMRNDISYLSRCMYGVLILPSGEFVEISDSDLDDAKEESRYQATRPDRVVWG